MVLKYFKIFSMIYLIVLAITFAVLVYLDNYSSYCTISFINGVSCDGTFATNIVWVLYMWILNLTVVPAAIYQELKISLSNITSPSLLPAGLVVALGWIPLFAGIWFWASTIFFKIKSMVR